MAKPHPLKGRKQTPEHIAKRAAAYPKSRRLIDPKQKILSKVIITESGCWQWLGSVFKKSSGSYGQIRIGRRGENKMLRAHRFSYEVFVGKIPEGLCLDHLCRNTLCVNPKHLEPVTHTENMKRGFSANKTHCKNGHERTISNIYINPKGAKECITCRNNRTKGII